MKKRIFKTYKHFTGERSAARAQILIGIVSILFGLIFFGANPEDIPNQKMEKCFEEQKELDTIAYNAFHSLNHFPKNRIKFFD